MSNSIRSLGGRPLRLCILAQASWMECKFSVILLELVRSFTIKSARKRAFCFARGTVSGWVFHLCRLGASATKATGVRPRSRRQAHRSDPLAGSVSRTRPIRHGCKRDPAIAWRCKFGTDAGQQGEFDCVADPGTGKAMLSFSGSLRVFVALEACDMRNHSECPIIPSGLRKPVESVDSSFF